MKNLRAKQWLALVLALTLWLSALPAGLAEALEAPVAELGELALPGEYEAVEAASIPSDETAAQNRISDEELESGFSIGVEEGREEELDGLSGVLIEGFELSGIEDEIF